MDKSHPKCYEGKKDCFARFDGHCMLLKGFNKEDGKRISATTKGVPCKFYKTAEEAGGTYEELSTLYSSQVRD